MTELTVSYTVTRFLSSCKPQIAKALQKLWLEGDQLAATAVPTDALPAVTILAAWGQRIDVEVVDDYPDLLDRMRVAFTENKNCHHPDLFLASCICILAEREQWPSIGSFEQVGVPAIFDELFGREE